MSNNDPTKPLTQGDIVLMMKSYENSILLNQTVVDQQKQVLEQQNLMLDKIKVVCNDLDEISDKLKECSNDINTISTHTSILPDLKSETKIQHTELSKEHLGINYRMYLSYAGLGSIVVSIIYLAAHIFSHLDKIDLIIKHLGVG
jgi:hypothetical protein